MQEAPWVIDADFLDKWEIDYVAHDEDPYAASGHDDVYSFVKTQGMQLCQKTSLRNQSRSHPYTRHCILTDARRDHFKANSSQHVEHLAYLPPNCWSASYQGIASATSTRSWKRLATPNSKPRDQISMTVLLLHVPRREREVGRGPQVLLRPTRCRRPFPAHLIQRRVSDSQ